MYTAYFGLKENPFNLTPDPRYLFFSPSHKEALNHLLYGINERKGFITIIGGVGTGKTTLCRALLSHLDASTKSALIFNAFVSDVELLMTINDEFGIKMNLQEGSKKDYIDALNRYLLENFRQGGNAVLLMDEAQNLSHDVLEQIRMLSNLETEREKLLQIVLVGQPELNELLSSPSLRQLDERIVVRYNLKPLDASDIKGYVEHRLVVAGSRGNLRFTKSGLKSIYDYSYGIPRRINAICDRALLIAYAQEKHTVNKSMVQRAIEELYGSKRREPVGRYLSWGKFVSYTVLLLLLLMAAAFAGLSFREQLLDIFSIEKTEVSVEPTKPAAAPETPSEPDKRIRLFLDEKTSLAALFDLYKNRAGEASQDLNRVHLTLVSFDLEPEYYIMLKKPFRVQLSDVTSAVSRYLLIQEITEGGAIAIDTEGKEQLVTRDFIRKNWGKRASWIYPFRDQIVNLSEGMDTPDVLLVQRILGEIGYLVVQTGVYDESTSKAVTKFQVDFGLMPDGIVGHRTRALLFQMSKNSNI